MDESMNYYREDSGLQDVINRYERMIQTEHQCYFDVYEFERIIDHYLDTEDYKQATLAMDFAVRQHPTAISLMLKKAQVLAESGKPGDGLSYIHKIERLEHANPDLFILKGSMLTQLGKLEKAENAFRSALNITYGDQHEILLDIALIYQNVQQYELALRYLTIAEQTKPGTPGILFELAYCHERLNNYKQAQEYYRKYLDIKPFSVDAWYNLGMLFYRIEDYVKAIECFDYALALNDKNTSAYMNKAGALVNMEAYREAISVYNEYLNIDDGNPMIHTYIGECYEKLEKYDQAIDYYNKALTLDKKFTDAWYGIGLCYFYKNKLSDSLFYLNKAIHLDPDNPDFWFTLGNVHAGLGSFKDAIKAYSRVEELDPYDYEAWIIHAELEYGSSGVWKAIDVLKKAYTCTSDVAQINYHLSAYYYLDGNMEYCLNFFRTGLLLNSGNYHQAFKICDGMQYDPEIISILKQKNK
jgi:tetratricopeptide (TPR) repeat protein